MELTEVSILGLGAEGSIAFRALMGKPCRVRILARGQRAQRLKAEGIWINGVHYDLHVAEPGAEPPPRLLIVAVKGYQLEDALDDAATETGPDTVVMSLMNGLTSEEVLARRIGADHLIYCMSRLNARKCGSHVEFQPVGDICIGERDGSVTDRIQADSRPAGRGGFLPHQPGDPAGYLAEIYVQRRIQHGGIHSALPPPVGSSSCRKPARRWNVSWRRSFGWQTPAALPCRKRISGRWTDILIPIPRRPLQYGAGLAGRAAYGDRYADRRSAGAGTQPRRRAAGMPVCLSSGQSHGAGKRLRSGDMVSCPSENVRAVFAVRKKKRRHGGGCAAAFPRSPADPAGKSLERICGGLLQSPEKPYIMLSGTELCRT